MRISQLDRYRHRNLRGYFQDLPWDARQRAYQWLDRFIRRREATHGSVPSWLFAIYVGQAKRLALNPPTSSWGRSMLAKRGGLAVQRRYRLEGRNATARATRCRVIKQNARKRAREQGKLLHHMGLQTPERVKHLPLD
ncbi:MAG: hypothetical protein DMG31_14105 [Acidobacteria bacterium]|nr:MAG: hypothetical protein DMG31_14105 [Acidobacteriota bacterium]